MIDMIPVTIIGIIVLIGLTIIVWKTMQND